MFLWSPVFCIDCVGRYCIGARKDGPLLSGSLRQFVEQLGDRTSSPGGGSASACMASMASIRRK